MSNIKQARERLGLTQRQLAEAISRDQPTISRYERGARPSVDDAPLLARALGLSVLEILYPSDDQQRVAATSGAVTRYDLRPDVFGPAPVATPTKRKKAA